MKYEEIIMKCLSKSFRALVCLLILGSAVSLVSGCAHHISSNVYSEETVAGPSVAYRGVIVSLREVCVENSETLNDNTAGMIAGGVVGGILGNQIGRGSGNAVATAAGALLGVAVGASAEQSMSRQGAYEYVVELDNGDLRVVIQGMDTVLWPGQPVIMIESQWGRPRLIPSY